VSLHYADAERGTGRAGLQRQPGLHPTFQTSITRASERTGIALNPHNHLGRSIRVHLSNVPIGTHWSRTCDDPLMTVSALGSSRHLARAWPTDLPLRRSFRVLRPTAALVIRAGFLVVLVPLDVRGFHLVRARSGHGWTTLSGCGVSPRWCREDPAACRVGSEGLKQRGRQPIRRGVRGGSPAS
jgi:hypothetical protein